MFKQEWSFCPTWKRKEEKRIIGKQAIIFIISAHSWIVVDYLHVLAQLFQVSKNFMQSGTQKVK